jgi:hypothetical protein
MNDHDLITTMRESFTDVRSATPVEQIVSRSQVIRARRRIPGAVAIVAVAAAAGTAVALIPAGSVKPAGVTTQTTAYVVSHVARALDAMPGHAVVATQWTPSGSTDLRDSWTNGAGGSRQEVFTAAGQPLSQRGISFSGSAGRMTSKVTVVNYQERTWWSKVNQFAGARTAPKITWTCGNAESVIATWNSGEMTGLLHTELSCGELKVTGHGMAGGIPTVTLSGTFSGGGTVTYWVNATTYLPVRFRWTSRAGLVFQMNLQWLPPTTANLAKVQVQIPAGFTHVSPPSS